MSVDSAVCARQRKVTFEIVQVIELLCPQNKLEMRLEMRFIVHAACRLNTSQPCHLVLNQRSSCGSKAAKKKTRNRRNGSHPSVR